MYYFITLYVNYQKHEMQSNKTANMATALLIIECCLV